MSNVKHRVRSWMPLYVGDYLASTSHLSTEQHGSLLLLFFHSWHTGKGIPDNDELLARICRLDAKDWKKHRPVLAEFFTVADGVWINGRIKREIDKAVKVSQKRQKSGSIGGQRSANSRAGIQANAQANASVLLKPGSTQSQSQSQDTALCDSLADPSFDLPKLAGGGV